MILGFLLTAFVCAVMMMVTVTALAFIAGLVIVVVDAVAQVGGFALPGAKVCTRCRRVSLADDYCPRCHYSTLRPLGDADE